MGWDLKATADTAINAIPEAPSLPADLTVQQTAAYIFAAIVLIGMMSALFRLVPRIWAALEETLFSNWRLALLGATGLALSLASGYTTWDGMRNFTGEATLSLLITFGIQGVMLIIAWLIGESFATGMSQKQGKGGAWDLVSAALFGILVFTAFGIWAGQGLTTSNASADNWFTSPAALALQSYAIFGAVGALILAFVFALGKSNLGVSYVQSTRVIIKNAVLWVMFLGCMATSVFFSFDSLFTAIFPQEERVRAAELRAQNQVAGVIADIGSTIDTRKVSTAQELFASEGWAAYDSQLSRLAVSAKESEGEVEAYFHNQAETRNRAIAEQQERVVSAQSGQAGLAAKKISLTDELARLKAERPTLAAEYAEKKNELDARAKEIDAKRVEAMAEEKGVEGTLKTGKGPIWRERMSELGKLNDYYKVGEQRVNDAKKRLADTETRIANIERELSQVDGDLAKLKGEEETANQRISMTQSSVSVDNGTVIDPSRMLPGFEKARADFRQEPTAERLSDVQKVCGQILGAMLTATPGTKAKVKDIDCDPKTATEAAAVLFTLNAGSQAFASNCAGGEKLSAHNSADSLFGFARRCLADSGLPSRDTDALRSKINFMELNRDDKAHRFVVTWNAFQDGNRLAYLALAIAIAIDALVFMSGLFGANVIRSPLSDVPSFKARSASQLEATINAGLGVHQYETAALVLGCLRPITNTEGYSAMADLSEVHPGVATRVRMVLTAGADIGAVAALPGSGERYLVRSELREYLATVYDRHLKSDATIVQLAKLEQILREALRPHTHEHADITLNYFKPIATSSGYTSIVALDAIANQYDQNVVRRVVNAGATVDGIATAGSTGADSYYIKPDVYRALLLIRANDLPSARFEADRNRFLATLAGAAIQGGALAEDLPPIAAPEERNGERLLTQQTPKEPERAASPPRPPIVVKGLKDLIEHFAMEIGGQTDVLARLIELGPEVNLGQVRYYLKSVANQHEGLAAIVGPADNVLAKGIADARDDALASGQMSETQAAELDALAGAIDRIRPLIMVSSGGAYRYALERMQSELQAHQAEGKGDRDQSALLEYVATHLREIKGADTRSKAGWDAILASLKSFNYWLGAYAGNDQQPPAGSV